MQYRHEIGHALAKLVLFEARNCNHWRDKLRCIIGLYLGHAPANLAFVAVLTSSFALLAFSKYWRAQIAPLTDLLYISRFILLVSTVLRFASLLVPAGSDCPSFMPILPLFHAYIASVASIHWLLQSFASLTFSKYRGSYWPLFKVYRVNIAPYYLFTLEYILIVGNYLHLPVWLVFSSSIHIEGYLNGEFLEFCVQCFR